MEWMCFINAQSKLGATSVVHAVMQQMRKAQSEDLHEACEVSILSSDTDHTPGSCSLCECKETILQHGSIFMVCMAVSEVPLRFFGRPAVPVVASFHCLGGCRLAVRA